MIVENRTILQDSHHRRQASALPRRIVFVRHRVLVCVIAIFQRGIFPLATAPVLQAVAGAVFDIIRRRGHNYLDAFTRHSVHHLDAITLMQDTIGHAVRRIALGRFAHGRFGPAQQKQAQRLRLPPRQKTDQ